MSKTDSSVKQAVSDNVRKKVTDSVRQAISDTAKKKITDELDKTWEEIGFANKAKLLYYGCKTICGIVLQKDEWRDHGSESLQKISKSFFIKKANNIGKDVDVKLDYGSVASSLSRHF